MLQLVYLLSPSLTAVLVVMAVACITDSDSGEELLRVFTVTSGKSVTNHFSSQWFVLLHNRMPLSFPLERSFIW